jgi:hypothetical protein
VNAGAAARVLVVAGGAAYHAFLVGTILGTLGTQVAGVASIAWAVPETTGLAPRRSRRWSLPVPRRSWHLDDPWG